MKKVITIVSVAVAALALAVLIPFTILSMRTDSLNADYAYLKEDDKYSTQVEVEGVELVTQHISCGYACIEMLSTYYGNRVSEDDLDAKNKGGVSTSSSSGFLKEVNSSIPDKDFVKNSYLKNDTLLKKIYDSLDKKNPVAIEWAAKYEGEWTLHFSIVTGLNIANDVVKVYNPYGSIESISVDEFLSRISFKSHQNLPLFLNFGFAFGAFEKNTIFYAKD